MHSFTLFPHLAAVSMRKNGRFYIPYLLTCVATSAMFYIMWYLQGNEGLLSMRGTGYVQVVLLLGCIVIAIFSAILLFYTNGFLMKRRRRELGLYNILGMEKRHIAQVMLWETIYAALIGCIGGIIVGVLLSKLLLLLLCALLKFEVQFGFEISVKGIVNTVTVFAVIHALNLLSNLRGVGKANPIELLYSGSTAEREPKTKWLTTVIGVLTLGAGYAIALIVKSPITALGLFFFAVMLVIVGTYCLFTSGSIALLKLLRANKGYYYQTKHFITVSGMLHRMKRNAAGLASICILSTMVLVTVSCTFCLYIGEEDTLANRYPYNVAFRYRDASDATIEAAATLIKEHAAASSVPLTGTTVVKLLDVNTLIENDTLRYIYQYKSDDKRISGLIVMPCRSYNAMSGESLSVSDGEVIFSGSGGANELPDSFTIGERSFKANAAGHKLAIKGEASVYVMRQIRMVVSDADFAYIVDTMRSESARFEADSDAPSRICYIETLIGVDLDCDEATEIAFAKAMNEILSDNDSDYDFEYDMFYSESRAENSSEFYVMYGGFFFLGIFLGTLFLMATILIIYYKQISEGYEDAERFKIMQQVGMSADEVRSGIKAQILTVFFLPLAAAGIHILAAFKMLTRLLTIFNLFSIGLFALCCAGTFILFAAIYMVIYSMTAKAYYGIVKM